MTALTSAQLSSMRSTVTGVLPDTATNARTTQSNLKCWLSPTGGTTQLAGDARFSPLPAWTLVFPYGTNVRHNDLITVTGKGQFYVTMVESSQVGYTTHLRATAVQVTDTAGDTEMLSTSSVTVKRSRSTVLSNVLVHIEPIDPRPFELAQLPDQAAGVTIFDKYVIFTLGTSLPDIRNRDEIIDSSDTDPLTGSASVYYVRRVKKWAGSHLEIEADRIATRSTM